MGIFDSLFSPAVNEESVGMIRNGALIIDVRTPIEFRMGHVEGSENIPLDQIRSAVQKLRDANKPVVLCCASGSRSGQAASYLKGHGIQCVNGGSWKAVRRIKNN